MLLDWSRRTTLSLTLIGLLSVLFSNSSAAQSTLSNLGAKTNFVEETTITLEDRWRSLGLFRKSLAYVKRVTPFYTWINLCNAVDLQNSGFLMGNCIEEQSFYLFKLYGESFRREYLAAIEHLWTRNELDAIKFSKAMAGQTTRQIHLDNLWPIVYVIGIAVVGDVPLVVELGRTSVAG